MVDAGKWFVIVYSRGCLRMVPYGLLLFPKIEVF